MINFLYAHGKHGNSSLELTNTGYADLKQLRDKGLLTPNALYRITNYEFTTTQIDTRSAGHVFDIVVMAISPTELSEEAYAVLHEGDKYFANSDLSAWHLWYTIDNDITRFYWADEKRGKGVIYRMIDEFGNDCPYDFKNAMFKKFTKSEESDKTNDDPTLELLNSTNAISSGMEITHAVDDAACYNINDGYCYTFSGYIDNTINNGAVNSPRIALNTLVDMSMNNWAHYSIYNLSYSACHLNIIKPTYTYLNMIQVKEEDTQAGESELRDTDMADETTPLRAKANKTVDDAAGLAVTERTRDEAELTDGSIEEGTTYTTSPHPSILNGIVFLAMATWIEDSKINPDTDIIPARRMQTLLNAPVGVQKKTFALCIYCPSNNETTIGSHDSIIRGYCVGSTFSVEKDFSINKSVNSVIKPGLFTVNGSATIKDCYMNLSPSRCSNESTLADDNNLVSFSTNTLNCIIGYQDGVVYARTISGDPIVIKDFNASSSSTSE